MLPLPRVVTSKSEHSAQEFLHASASAANLARALLPVGPKRHSDNGGLPHAGHAAPVAAEGVVLVLRAEFPAQEALMNQYVDLRTGEVRTRADAT